MLVQIPGLSNQGVNLFRDEATRKTDRSFPQKPATIPQFPQNKALIINTNRKSAFYPQTANANVVGGDTNNLALGRKSK